MKILLKFPFLIKQTADDAVMVLLDAKKNGALPRLHIEFPNGSDVQKAWHLPEEMLEKLHEEFEKKALLEVVRASVQIIEEGGN